MNVNRKREIPDYFADSASQRKPAACVTCGDSVQGVSCIACSKCSRWTHAKHSCSSLSLQQVKTDAVVNGFVCADCSAPQESSADSVMDTSTAPPLLRSVLDHILRELTACKHQLSKMNEANCALRKDNSDLKNGFVKLQRQISSMNGSPSTATAPPSTQPRRASSRSRNIERTQHNNFHNRSRSSSRPTSILRNGNAQTLPLKPKHNKSYKTNTKTHVRSSNARVVSDAAYASTESKANLVRALPVTTVKHCTKTVFVALYNSAASAADVLQHLRRNKYDIIEVQRIKARSRSDGYRCFAIHCSDLEFDGISNDENLWHPGSIVGEMRKVPREDQILETAPVSQ